RAAWQDSNVVIEPMVRGQSNTCLEGIPALSTAECFNAVTGELSGSYRQDWNDHRQRLTAWGDATVFAGRWLGASHELKLGMIVENERYARDLDRRPDISFFILDTTDQTNPDAEPEQTGVIFGNFSAPTYSEITARGVTWGFYARDEFKPRQNLSVSLGFRVDREEIRSDGMFQFDPEAEATRWHDLRAQGYPVNQVTQTTFTSYEAVQDFFRQVASTLQVNYSDIFGNQATVTQESSFWHHERRPENINIANTNFAPRLSLSWDPFSDAKTKIAVSAGRYYNNIPLNVPLLELEPPSTTIAFDLCRAEPADNPNAACPGTRPGRWVYDGLRTSVNPAV
ncbi:MAG: hypothetical protein R3344_15995, partial [Acidobacteriota bacterium]|nr:hypothetical protein [Acidobacteriota bacterium]